MKKLLITLALAAVTVAVPLLGVRASCAEKQVRREDEIRAICMEDKRVKDAVCVIFGNTCGVALRCETLYFQDELNRVKSNVIKGIKERFPEIGKLYVRCDLDIFLKAQKIDKKLKDGSSVLSLKDEILEVLRLCEKRD